jgi:hypothetical protein
MEKNENLKPVQSNDIEFDQFMVEELEMRLEAGCTWYGTGNGCNPGPTGVFWVCCPV